jgi:hypothetical protein
MKPFDKDDIVYMTASLAITGLVMLLSFTLMR